MRKRLLYCALFSLACFILVGFSFKKKEPVRYFGWCVVNDTKNEFNNINIDYLDGLGGVTYSFLEPFSKSGTIGGGGFPEKVKITWDINSKQLSDTIEVRKHLSKDQFARLDTIVYVVSENGKASVRFELDTEIKHINTWYIPGETPESFNKRKSQELLKETIKNGNVSLAKSILEKNVSINPQSYFDPIPLSIAVQHDQIEFAKYLVKKGAWIEMPHDKGTSVLSQAVFNGNKELVEFLVKNGADVNFTMHLPLNYACQKGYSDIVKYLIKNGADVHLSDGGQTPMANAIRSKNIETVNILLQSGVSPHEIWNNDNYINFSKGYGTPEILKLLQDWPSKQKMISNHRQKRP